MNTKLLIAAGLASSLAMVSCGDDETNDNSNGATAYTVELTKDNIAKVGESLDAMNVAEDNADSAPLPEAKALAAKEIMTEISYCEAGQMSMTADVVNEEAQGDIILELTGCTFDGITSDGEITLNVSETVLTMTGGVSFSGIDGVSTLQYKNLNMNMDFETFESTMSFDVNIVSDDLTGVFGISSVDNDDSSTMTLTGANNTQATYVYSYETYEENCTLNGEAIECSELNFGEAF